MQTCPLIQDRFFYNNKKSSPNWCKRVPSYKTVFFYNKVPLLMHDCPLTNAEASLNVIRAFHNSLVYICLPVFYLWRNCFQLCTSPSPDQYGDTASCFNLIAFSVDFYHVSKIIFFLSCPFTDWLPYVQKWLSVAVQPVKCENQGFIFTTLVMNDWLHVMK